MLQTTRKKSDLLNVYDYLWYLGISMWVHNKSKPPDFEVHPINIEAYTSTGWENNFSKLDHSFVPDMAKLRPARDFSGPCGILGPILHENIQKRRETSQNINMHGQFFCPKHFFIFWIRPASKKFGHPCFIQWTKMV